MRRLLRITEDVVNKPQLISQESFTNIMSYLSDRNMGINLVEHDALDEEFVITNSDSATAIINFEGTLTAKPMFNMATCGGNVSYQALKQTFRELLDNGYTNIAMVVDSGGGQAKSCFDSARYVRKLLNEYGATLTAYVDGSSASAAYAWTAIADEIIMSSDSKVGSIGVVCQLVDRSKSLEMQGLKPVFVYSGENKIAFNEDGSFSQTFLDEIQKDCDSLYSEFINHISSCRDIESDVVKKTAASMFGADEAITLGLADKVMTYEEFMDYLADKATANKTFKRVSTPSRFSFLNKQENQNEMTKITQLEQALAEATATLSEQELKVVEMTTQLEQKEEAFKEMALQLEEMNKEKTALTEQLTQLQEEAQVKKLQERQAKLSAVLPEDQVETQMEALSQLDDVAFEAVVAAMGGIKSTKASSEMFTETGDSGASMDSELSEFDKLQAATKKHLQNQ